jgi:hypothetical protein
MCDISFNGNMIASNSKKSGNDIVIDNDRFYGVRVHSDKCGIGTELNALQVKFPPPQAPAE